LVRIAGYPAIGKSFRTQLEAKLRAARTEAAAKRRAHWHPLGG